MLKGTDVIGLPVVTFAPGERVEKVTDVVFDHERRKVLGLVVDDGGWFRGARVVPFASAPTIGPDAVIIPTRDAVATRGQQGEIRRVLERDNILKGTRIVTTDGRDLGTLRDLYFDEATGDVEGFEVSGGMFADAYEGRSFVPASTAITIGEAVAFVTPETATLMEEQVGGLRGAVEGAGESLRSSAASAGERSGEGWDRTREGARHGEELDPGRSAREAAPATLEEAWGRGSSGRCAGRTATWSPRRGRSPPTP